MKKLLSFCQIYLINLASNIVSTPTEFLVAALFMRETREMEFLFLLLVTVVLATGSVGVTIARKTMAEISSDSSTDY